MGSAPGGKFGPIFRANLPHPERSGNITAGGVFAFYAGVFAFYAA
jgi:hypothetical protein